MIFACNDIYFKAALSYRKCVVHILTALALRHIPRSSYILICAIRTGRSSNLWLDRSHLWHRSDLFILVLSSEDDKSVACGYKLY